MGRVNVRKDDGNGGFCEVGVVVIRKGCGRSGTEVVR